MSLMPRTLLVSAAIMCALPAPAFTPAFAQDLPAEFGEPMPLYEGALGPFGFCPSELESAIKKELSGKTAAKKKSGKK